MFLWQAVLLVSLVKVLMEIESPLLCASLYAVAETLFNLLSTIAVVYLAVHFALAFMAALLYFWLLSKFEPMSFVWLLVFVSGFPIVLI